MSNLTSIPSNIADLLRDSATDALYANIELEATKTFNKAETKEFLEGVTDVFQVLRDIPRV